MEVQAGVSTVRRDALVWAVTVGIALTAGIALLLVPVELVFGAVIALLAASVFLVSSYAGALAFIALYYMRPMDFFPRSWRSCAFPCSSRVSPRQGCLCA